MLSSMYTTAILSEIRTKRVTLLMAVINVYKLLGTKIVKIMVYLSHLYGFDHYLQELSGTRTRTRRVTIIVVRHISKAVINVSEATRYKDLDSASDEGCHQCIQDLPGTRIREMTVMVVFHTPRAVKAVINVYKIYLAFSPIHLNAAENS